MKRRSFLAAAAGLLAMPFGCGKEAAPQFVMDAKPKTPFKFSDIDVEPPCPIVISRFAERFSIQEIHDRTGRVEQVYGVSVRNLGASAKRFGNGWWIETHYQIV